MSDDTEDDTDVWPNDILLGDCDIIDVGAVSIDNWPDAPGYVTFSSMDNPQPTVHLDEHGIKIEGDADITIHGKSLSETLEGIEDRLKILTPDFEKLEQYPALKAAYEQYKLIERLLEDGQRGS